MLPKRPDATQYIMLCFVMLYALFVAVTLSQAYSAAPGV